MKMTTTERTDITLNAEDGGGENGDEARRLRKERNRATVREKDGGTIETERVREKD
jgi:hypothetical protein